MDIYEIFKRIGRQQPLVHHLTNWVTIYECAAVVKTFGGSPIMAHSSEEVADISSMSSSLVLNIGTLTTEFVDMMKLATHAANDKNIPVILDVCGAGATAFRDRKSFELLDEYRIDIIKGNASEIARIAGEHVRSKGVDTGDISNDMLAVAGRLARERKCTVAVTGREDVIVDKDRHFIVKNGHEIMSHIVGTGCMTTSVLGTFAAVESDHAIAAAAGLCCFGIAAEIAVGVSQGAGTFKVNLFDAIYNLSREDIESRKKIEN